jgi:hypothetical protein
LRVFKKIVQKMNYFLTIDCSLSHNFLIIDIYFFSFLFN